MWTWTWLDESAKGWLSDGPDSISDPYLANSSAIFLYFHKVRVDSNWTQSLYNNLTMDASTNIPVLYIFFNQGICSFQSSKYLCLTSYTLYSHLLLPVDGWKMSKSYILNRSVDSFPLCGTFTYVCVYLYQHHKPTTTTLKAIIRNNYGSSDSSPFQSRSPLFW